LTDGDETFAGCNIENISYGLTICAERNAIFQAIARGKKHIKALLLYTPTAQPITPCGACRQVVAEFGRDADIISVCDGTDVIRTDLKTLLAMPFDVPKTD
jgi:cytidine deaminase